MHTVTLIRSPLPGKVITLPHKLGSSLSLADGDCVTLRAGQRTASDVRVTVRQELSHETVGVSASLALALSLPLPLRLHLQQKSDGTLRLGPFIGILALATRSRSERFMSQTPYFAALIRMGRRLSLPTFVFTPGGIDWQRRRVYAWSVRRGGWYRLHVPLPDVVYDRVQTRRLDLLPSTVEAKRRLKEETDAKIFNTGFLDKWETHRALESAETQQFLPETRLLSHRQDLHQFTKRYRTVYVKPAGGSLGQGIYVLQRRRQRRFHVIHYGTQRVRRFRNLRSVSPIWNRLRRLKERRRYVVQQGLQFARYRGCRFDLRLLAQKGLDNKWQITAMYARVAPPGSLRANLDAGGRAVRSSRVLRRIFGRSSTRVSQRIVQAGLAVAGAMEARSAGPLGELGIDIGVDRAGRPWIIEANSKPLRQMEGPPRRLARTLRRPLRYAQHLAGFV